MLFVDSKVEIENAVLLMIDKSKPFVVKIDTSVFCLAVTLNQSGQPVAFFSHTLSKMECQHSSVERETVAIVEVLCKCHHCLILLW